MHPYAIGADSVQEAIALKLIEITPVGLECVNFCVGESVGDGDGVKTEIRAYVKKKFAAMALEFRDQMVNLRAFIRAVHHQLAVDIVVEPQKKCTEFSFLDGVTVRCFEALPSLP